MEHNFKNKKIIQYWHQEELPDAVLNTQNSWKAIKGWEFKCYTKEEAEVFLHKHFGEKVLNMFMSCAVPAMASDFFRIHYLAINPGLYIDAKFECIDKKKIIQQFSRFKNNFATSTPKNDVTQEVVTAKKHIKTVLINWILYSPTHKNQYYHLLAKLIQKLLVTKADAEIPYVTGVGVLSVFDYLVRNKDLETTQLRGSILKAIPKNKEKFVDTVLAFFIENKAVFRQLDPIKSVDYLDVMSLFSIPKKLSIRTEYHWTNHKGSIYTKNLLKNKS